jgi:hypothetical protein
MNFHPKPESCKPVDEILRASDEYFHIITGAAPVIV